MSDALQYIQVLAIPGLGGLLLAIVFRAMRHYVRKVEDERLRGLLLELVKAAEQIYGPGEGAVKAQYVEEQAMDLGLTRVPQASIEAAVFDMKTGPAA